MNEITVVELKKMFDENENFVLLDVREKEELQILNRQKIQSSQCCLVGKF